MNYKKLIPIADAISTLSKDPSTKIGAIIFDDIGAILSSGCNSFPCGVSHTDHRLDTRTIKYSYIVHAEANAISFAARNGVRLLGSNLLVTQLWPCSSCCKLIIQSGIKRVYVPKDLNASTQLRWKDDAEISKTMFREAKIEIIEYET